MNSTGQAAPSFLTIGHASRDLMPGGWRWGGTVTYAALLARTWGVSAAVLTALAPEDEPLYQAFLGSDVMLHTLPSKNTTSMANEYTAAGRRQQLAAKASKIHPRHVPTAWRDTPIVLVAPLFGEVSTQFGGSFPQGSLVGMTIQGRLRSHRKGRIYSRRWHRAEQEFSAYDIIFFSEEDVRGNAELAEYYASLVPLAVMTQGHSGATSSCKAELCNTPPFRPSPWTLPARATCLRLHSCSTTQRTVIRQPLVATRMPPPRAASSTPARVVFPHAGKWPQGCAQLKVPGWLTKHFTAAHCIHYLYAGFRLCGFNKRGTSPRATAFLVPSPYRGRGD